MKNEITVWFNSPTSGYISEGNEITISRVNYTPVFIAHYSQ